MQENNKIRVWDLPLRIFHWSLFVLVSVSLYTGLNGGFVEMDYHMLSGYGILALVTFRILWGFFGSHHARFSSFLSLRGIVTYARGVFRRDAPGTTGHNPLGSLSVVAMLLVLLVQAGTGLFSDDDIMTSGPLTHLVSEDLGDQLTGIHHLNAWLLYGLLGLHLAAISFYELYRRERLIQSMLTGKKTSTEVEPQASNLKEIVTAVILLTVTGSGVYYLVNYL